MSEAGSDGGGNDCTERARPCRSPPAAYAFVQRHVDIAGLAVTVHLLSNFSISDSWAFSGSLTGGRGPGSFVINGSSTDDGKMVTVRLLDHTAAPTVGLFFAADGAEFTLADMRLASPIANGYTVLVGDGAVHVSGLHFLQNRSTSQAGAVEHHSVVAGRGPSVEVKIDQFASVDG